MSGVSHEVRELASNNLVRSSSDCGHRLPSTKSSVPGCPPAHEGTGRDLFAFGAVTGAKAKKRWRRPPPGRDLFSWHDAGEIGEAFDSAGERVSGSVKVQTTMLSCKRRSNSPYARRSNITMPVRYSTDHEYVAVENGVGTVGITEQGQEKLSDVTSVELPRVGEQVKKGAAVGVVESVKAANDLYSPVSGEILAVNEALNGKPELVNQDAEGAGWIFKIKLAEPSEFDVLLDREAYLSYVRKQG